LPSYETVTIARNEAANIAPTLASISGQSLRPSNRIVVDDGSDDGTGDTASRLGCTVVRLPPHPQSYLGRPELASVLNAGLRKVSGSADYVVNVDADNPLPPTYVSRLLGLMERERDVVAASGNAGRRAFRPRNAPELRVRREVRRVARPEWDEVPYDLRL